MTDVAWCRSVGVQQDLIAMSAENNQVIIWRSSDPKGNWAFDKVYVIDTDSPAWCVNWSPSGFLLAVSCNQ